jgi:hypothetical protein
MSEEERWQAEKRRWEDLRQPVLDELGRLQAELKKLQDQQQSVSSEVEHCRHLIESSRRELGCLNLLVLAITGLMILAMFHWW